MSELDARCEDCGLVLPDADIRAMIAAEEENRRSFFRRYQLLCPVCFYRRNTEYDSNDDGEPPKVWSF